MVKVGQITFLAMIFDFIDPSLNRLVKLEDRVEVRRYVDTMIDGLLAI
jgi:hypothetical protein